MSRPPLFGPPALVGDGPLPDPAEAAANAVRGVLSERNEEAARKVARRTKFRDWIQLVPEVRGPLDLDRFRFQADLYEQHAVEDREQVYKKATQVGVSTHAIRVALFHADVMQNSGLYTFPTEKELGDFSRKRIGPVIRASPHLLSRMGSESVDNVLQKQIGANGWIQFRGTNKPIDSLDIDIAIFDEYDTSDQANIEASERRVSGPFSAGLLRRVGVPSIPGFGIAKAYEQSDQRVWTVKCEACAKHNPLRGYEAFEHNVDQDRALLVCRQCRRQLDPRAGEWVAAYPGREVHGWHIPKLLIPGLDLRPLIANSRKTAETSRTAFMTRDLGEEYSSAENRLSLEQVKRCVRPGLQLLQYLETHQLVTMGIDAATTRPFTVTVEEAIDQHTGRKVWVGGVEDIPGGATAFQRLCHLMDSFGVKVAVIDHLPEGRLARALRARYPGRVFLASYFTPQPGARKQPSVWQIDEAEGDVSLWRSRVMEATLERFRLQRVLLPPLDLLPEEYAAELGNAVRRVEETPNGPRVDYVHVGPADFAHAETYNTVAIELFWHFAGRRAVAGTGPVPVAQTHPDAFEDTSDLGGDLDVWAEPTYE